MSIKVAMLDGGETKIADDELEQLRGDVLTPADLGFADNPIYNAMHQRCPALKVRVADTADVVDVVNFARDRNLLVAVRGGGTPSPVCRAATAASSSTSLGCGP
jgi:hypothetical protein